MKKTNKKLNKELRWECISSKEIFNHPRITIIEDDVLLPNNQKTSYIKFNPGNQSITVVCIKNNCVLLQQEYSYPTNEVLYQFPGGKVEINESPRDAARRELKEESSLDSDNLQEIGWYYSNNRRSDAKMYVFLAEETKTTDSIDGDIEENIVSNWIPIDEFEQLIKSGQIVNFSVLSAWTLYKNRN